MHEKQIPIGQLLTFIFGAVIAGLLIFVFNIWDYNGGLILDGKWHEMLGYQELFDVKWKRVWAMPAQIGIILLVTTYVGFVLASFKGTNDTGAANVAGFVIGALAVFVCWWSGSLLTRWFDYSVWLVGSDPVATGIVDPIFGKDVSFYMFTLQYREQLELLAYAGVIMFGIGAFAGYVINLRGYGTESGFPIFVVGFCIGLLFLINAWDNTAIQPYNLMFSGEGTIFGVAATEYARNIPILRFSVLFYGIAGIVAILIAFASWAKRDIAVVYPVQMIVMAIFMVFFAFLPSCYQTYTVEARGEKGYELGELGDLGQNFQAHNINGTIASYQLDSVTKIPFEYKELSDSEALTLALANPNLDTLRAWRPATASPFIQRNQTFVTYDACSSMQADRYSGYPVMICGKVRDFSKGDTAAKNRWQRAHEIVPANSGIVVLDGGPTTGKGETPNFFVSGDTRKNSLEYNVPAEINIPVVTQPEIYFGVGGDFRYALVNTSVSAEFGDYQGSSGITITDDNRIWLAWLIHGPAGENNFFGYFSAISRSESIVNGQSKALIHRNAINRVRKLVPFLSWSNDAHYVIREDGSIAVLVNGMTKSNYYPYATRYQGANYMRHAVVAVVDAYNGSVEFYKADESDFMLQTYEKVYPGIFQPKAEMPTDLAEHVRYPDELTKWRVAGLAEYHVTDPSVFFDNSLDWQLSKEIIGEQGSGGTPDGQTISPYYQMFMLPGQNTPTFQSIIAMSLDKKNNLSAIGAFSNEFTNDQYGHLTVVEMTGGSQVAGFMDIEEAINGSLAKFIGDATRSNTLVRGNMTPILVDSDLLYIEPLMTLSTSRSDQAPLPKPEGWVAAKNGRAALGDTVEEAVRRLYSNRPSVSNTALQESDDSNAAPVATSIELPENFEEMTDIELVTAVKQLFTAAENEPNLGEKGKLYGQAEAATNLLLNRLSQEDIGK